MPDKTNTNDIASRVAVLERNIARLLLEMPLPQPQSQEKSIGCDSFVGAMPVYLEEVDSKDQFRLALAAADTGKVRMRGGISNVIERKLLAGGGCGEETTVTLATGGGSFAQLDGDEANWSSDYTPATNGEVWMKHDRRSDLWVLTGEFLTVDPVPEEDVFWYKIADIVAGSTVGITQRHTGSLDTWAFLTAPGASATYNASGTAAFADTWRSRSTEDFSVWRWRGHIDTTGYKGFAHDEEYDNNGVLMYVGTETERVTLDFVVKDVVTDVELDTGTWKLRQTKQPCTAIHWGASSTSDIAELADYDGVTDVYYSTSSHSLMQTEQTAKVFNVGAGSAQTRVEFRACP